MTGYYCDAVNTEYRLENWFREANVGFAITVVTSKRK